MANNILSAKIDVTAPNIAATAATVSKSTDKMAASLKKVAPASTQATASLTNFGRIVQDAPFGLIGVTNNINPLVESFQRLKASTGTTGGALKALGKDLLGAGGVGVAVSLLSTGLLLFGDRLFGAGKKAKEAADENDKFKKSVDSIFSSVAKEAAETTSFVAVLKSETETRERKLAAIKELQRIQPEIFKDLKLEGDVVSGLDTAYKNYLLNLKTVIAAKIKQTQLEQLLEKQLRAEGATLTKSEKAFQDGVDQVKNYRKERAAAAGERSPFEVDEKAAKKLQSDIDALVSDLGELSLGVKVTPVKPDKDTTNDIIAQAKRIYEAFKDIISLRLNIRADDDIKTQLQKAQKFLDKYSRGEYKLTVPVGLRIDEKDVVRPKEFTPAATTMAQMFGNAFNSYFAGEAFDPSIIRAMQDWAKDERIRQAGKALGKSFNDSLGSALASGLESIGEGLGNILSGKGFGAGIINVIGSLIEELGKALIQYGLIKQGLDKIIAGGIAIPGIAAIGLGVAAIAIGQAFKNFGGFRAAGGSVAAGTGYIVGEKGPEWFQPNTGGTIIPNHALASGGMGGAVRVFGEFRQRGNDLVAVISSTNRYQGRNT